MKKPALFLLALLGAVMLFAAACSDEADPNATATPRPPDTVAPSARTPLPDPTATTVPTPAPTREPGSSSGPVSLTIGVNGEALEFDADSMTAAAGTDVTVLFNNTSVVNQHNWVLVPTSTKDDVAAAGTAAGPANHWIPVGDDRVLASTVLLNPGESGTAEFTAPAAGTYQFVCTFPGHNFTMFGDFVTN